MGYLYTVKHYSTIKKIIVIPFAATWMGLEIVRLSETEKNKYHMVSLIVDLKKMVQINLFTKQK